MAAGLVGGRQSLVGGSAQPVRHCYYQPLVVDHDDHRLPLLLVGGRAAEG